MDQPIHILTQMGVLKSFSVAKKVTEDDINAFFRKHKRSGKSEEEIGILLREQIFDEIRDALMTKKIPGLITPLEIINPLVEEKINKNLAELNRFIMIVAHKILEKRYDKLSLCYFINSLVNSLGLTEKDFNNFHKKMQNSEEDEDGEEDE